MGLPTLVEVICFNAAAATLLALVAAAVGRLTRRPGVAHAMWALVLVKLLFPPVIEMAVVPRSDVLRPGRVAHAPKLSAAGDALLASATRGETAAPRAAATPPATGIPLTNLALAAWAAGSLALLGLTIVRVYRFRRLVASGHPAPAALTRAAGELARVLRVRCPSLKVVAARVSPMLWCPGHRPMLLFPAALLEALDRGERDALVAHELAHVRRRDHLLRFVELLATIVFWWHPVVWWARLRLRQLEERSCDAVVLEALPGQGGSYARGLVKTVEFLAGGPARVPALASGAARNGAARHLEERLTMILNDDTPRLLSRTQRALLAVVAVGALLVVPSWADPRGAAVDDATVDDEYRQRLRDVELQAIELERSMHDLEGRRREIELERAQLERELQVALIRDRAEAAEREGRVEQADLMRQKADHLEQRAFHEREARRLQGEHVRRAREMELELRLKSIEANEAHASGDTARAENLRRAQTELEEQLLRMQSDMAAAHHDDVGLDAAHAEKLARAEFERAEALKLAAEADYAAEIDRAAEMNRAIELELQERSADERKARRAQVLAQLAELHAEARRLEDSGEAEKAEALWQNIQLLKMRLAVLDNAPEVH